MQICVLQLIRKLKNFVLICTFLLQITQIECDSDIRAPQGCTQYFYGSDSQQVRSYNFNAGQGLHLGKWMYWLVKYIKPIIKKQICDETA